MSIYQRVKSAFRSEIVQTKQPGFVVTNFSKNNIFEGILEDNANYLDQNYLYTFKAIDFISDAVAEKQPELRLEKGEDFQTLTEKTNDLMSDLESFNPWMNLYDARKLKEVHLRLTGAAFWFIARKDLSDGFKQAEFYPLDPTKVDIDTDQYGLPRMFKYRDGDGSIIDILPENMIYFRRVNPKNWIKGYSQVEAIKFIHNAYSFGTQHNMNLFENNARPDFLLQVPGVSEEQRKAIQSDLRQRFGGVRNAGSAGVVNSEMKLLELTKSNKDLDYVEGMKMLRQDILALFGIPEALMFPSATNSNTTEARNIFQRNTVAPALAQEASVLNEQLIPKYYLNRRSQELSNYCFVFENIVDVDPKVLSETIEIQLNSGAITRNEARKALGLDTVTDGDVFMKNPAAEVSLEPDTEQDEAEEVVDEESGEVKRLRMDVMELKSIVNVDKDSDISESRLRQKQAFNEAENATNEFQPSVMQFFEQQAARTIDAQKSRKNPSLKGLFPLEEEISITKKFFQPIYERTSSSANDDVHIEVKQKLFKAGNPRVLDYKAKTISESTQKMIMQRLNFFSKEINNTTKEKLQSVISKAIQEEMSVRQSQKLIAAVFNGYLEGEGNVDILKKYGVYVDKVDVTTDGESVISSGNRYNAMLEKITQTLEGEQQQEALKALKGALDITDPIGKQVDTLLTSVYKITANEVMDDYRARAISRTEVNTIRNFTYREEYEQNEFVKGLEWISALQPGVTRDAHLDAYGQVVERGEPFIVGGEKLMSPGDSSLGASASNTINCRCRIVAVVE